jgi:DNA-binding CsgD family transcriptional regulator
MDYGAESLSISLIDPRRREDLDSNWWPLIDEGLEEASSARNLKEFYAHALTAAARLVPHDVGTACFLFERGIPRLLASEPEGLGLGFNERYRYMMPVDDIMRTSRSGGAVIDFADMGDLAYVRDCIAGAGIGKTLAALDGDFQLCVYRSSRAPGYRPEEIQSLVRFQKLVAAFYRWIREAERALRLTHTPSKPSACPMLLTRRELEVLSCLERGMSARDIALALEISPRTAERHTANIYDKLGVRSRSELAGRLSLGAGNAY